MEGWNWFIGKKFKCNDYIPEFIIAEDANIYKWDDVKLLVNKRVTEYTKNLKVTIYLYHSLNTNISYQSYVYIFLNNKFVNVFKISTWYGVK
jgi:hypothetical protein